MGNLLLVNYIILFIAEALILVMTCRLHIGQESTHRSAPNHRGFMPSCGGLVVTVALILYMIENRADLPPSFAAMAVGAGALCVVSFIDDIRQLTPTLRLLVQICAVALMLSPFVAVHALYALIIALIFSVGFMNALNFLDGIDGMLAFMGLVTLGSLAYALDSVVATPCARTLAVMAVTVMAALTVFATFNITHKIFAGDCGSIVLGFVISYLLVWLIFATGQFAYVVFIAVCVFDCGMTTLGRLFRGKNIFQPHRENIYQKLVTDWHVKPLVVSGGYALLQTAINVLYFTVPTTQRNTCLIVVCLVLTVTYFILRRAHAPQPRN